MDKNMKDAYVKKQAAELQKIDAQLQGLETKVYSTEGKVRARQQKQLDELKQKRVDINNRLEKLESTGTDAWLDIKRVIETTKNEISRAIRRSMAQLKK